MSLLDFFLSGSGSPIAPKPLRFWHGFQALAFAMFLMLFISIVLALLGSTFNAFSRWWFVCLNTVLMSILFAGCAVLVVIRLGYANLAPIIGPRPRRFPVAIAVLGIFPAGVLADHAAFLLHVARPDIFSVELLDELNKVFQAAPLHGAILMSVAIAVFPAIGEELMFRGIVLQSFRRDMPASFAVVFSSILFGVVHLNWLQGTAAGLIGLYLGIVTVLTGSLHAALIAHFANNLFAAVVARTDLFNLDSVTVEGHPPVVVGLASLLVALIVFVLWRFRAR